MISRHSFRQSISPVRNLLDALGLPPAQNSSYEQVKTEEDNRPHPRNDRQSEFQRRHSLFGAVQPLLARCSRRLVLFAVGLVALLVLLANLLLSTQAVSKSISNHADHRLYLLIPSTNEPDIGFCRTVLSAGILGYPTPYILNREDRPRDAAGKEREKIRTTNDHLNDMAAAGRDDDLVVLLDRPESWFQLRAEVLVKRYYRLVEQANRRLSKGFGKEGPPVQRIIFGAQNHCSGHALDELACFAPPDNPSDATSALKFLNAGVAIGPVRDLRRLFNRLNGKSVLRMGEEISQQSLLAEIFGEQEFQREYVRQSSWSSGKRTVQWMLKTMGFSRSSSIHIPGRKLLENPEKSDYEMGMGLDYGNELGLSVSRHAEQDSVHWVRHSAEPAWTGSFPSDVKNSMPPFWTTTEANLPNDVMWADVPLLTSKRTGGIPAVVNAGGEGGATTGNSLDWRSIWLHSHASRLWEAQQEIPRLPVMSVGDGSGTEHTFWDQELRRDRDGANWIDGGWKPWTDHCGFDETGEVVLRSKIPEGQGG